MSLVVMQTLVIGLAMVTLFSSSAFAQAQNMSQKDFHKDIVMAQITAFSLDYLLKPEHSGEICKSLYGMEKTPLSGHDDNQIIRSKIHDNLKTHEQDIVNSYFMAHDHRSVEKDRFFNVYQKKVSDFSYINRAKLETEKHSFYPYLKASKFFSKEACETGSPWPESLADIRAEMDSLKIFAPLGGKFKTTYRSLLQ